MLPVAFVTTATAGPGAQNGGNSRRDGSKREGPREGSPHLQASQEHFHGAKESGRGDKSLSVHLLTMFPFDSGELCMARA